MLGGNPSNRPGGGRWRTPPSRNGPGALSRRGAERHARSPYAGCAVPPDVGRCGWRNPGTRLRVGLFAVAFLLSLFAGRLLQLQGVEASAYATVADTERRITETVSATRGSITDRSGVPLATTVDTVNVFADQTQVENPGAHRPDARAVRGRRRRPRSSAD